MVEKARALSAAIKAFDYVITLSNKTYLFNPKQGYVVEWLMGCNKTVGISNKRKIGILAHYYNSI